MRPIRLGLAAAAAVMLAVAPVATAYADPPPWAPAHGWRAKHDKHRHKRREEVHVYHHYDQPDRYRQPVIVQQGPSFGCDRSLLTGNKTLLAQILGGAGGAVAGAQFGQGSGKLAATAGGALLGVLLGTEVGGSLDAADAACARYSVVPTRTYQASGTYCREYTTRARVGGRTQEAYGTACRQPDGSWRIVRQ
ncbi:MAG: glycine zipper 2TM domain-containing protein [Thalassobaculum sp.]|uniref:glycine zipper 2TM domain-containing protein n=1 Tax=Thalassobaculum sp. TaxID=2022740 RepID=UPI0032EBBF7E